MDSIWMRPERAAAGRPARYSRAAITAAALAIADADGLDAVSMRRVAAELGTGAASLYRYVETRDELLDLMTDGAGAEYELSPPSGDWLADLIAVGEQERVVLRRHPWLAGLSITRPVIGPHGIALVEHVLEVLRSHPAGAAAKMEAFAMLNGVTAAFVLQELADPDLRERNTAYLLHAIAAGQRPGLAQFIAQPPAAEEMNPADRYPDLMGRILTGILGPASLSAASLTADPLRAGGPARAQLGELGAGGGDQVGVGVRVAPDAPTALGCLGEQHPGTVAEASVAGRLRDDVGEPAHHGELLVPVKRARVGQYLDPDVAAVAVDVGQAVSRQLVHERRGVLAEHGNVGNLLDRHDRRREVPRQRAGVRERAGRGVDVDHRHGCPPQPRYDVHHNDGLSVPYDGRHSQGE